VNPRVHIERLPPEMHARLALLGISLGSEGWHKNSIDVLSATGASNIPTIRVAVLHLRDGEGFSIEPWIRLATNRLYSGPYYYLEDAIEEVLLWLHKGKVL
jgi:hypothetical protein